MCDLAEDGNVVHLLAPEYHRNPVDESGALVTFRYRRDLTDVISEWAPFSLEVARFNDRYHGIVVLHRSCCLHQAFNIRLLSRGSSANQHLRLCC